MIEIKYSRESYKEALSVGIAYGGDELSKKISYRHQRLKDAILGFFMHAEVDSVSSKMLQTAVRDIANGGQQFITEPQRLRQKKLFCEVFIRSAAELELIKEQIVKAIFATDPKDAVHLLGIAEFELHDTISRLRQQIKQSEI